VSNEIPNGVPIINNLIPLIIHKISGFFTNEK
jgi:hypothetical protein